MQPEWPVLEPGDTVESAIRLFVKSGISGAPVVEGGALIGVLTEGDLIFRDAEIRSPGFWTSSVVSCRSVIGTSISRRS